MAKLASTWYPFQDKRADESWDQYSARADAMFKDLRERSDALPEGEVIGALIRFQVADGYASYFVTKEKPLTLQCIPFGDRYQIDAAHIRGLRKVDILEMLRREKAWLQLFQKNRPA